MKKEILSSYWLDLSVLEDLKNNSLGLAYVLNKIENFSKIISPDKEIKIEFLEFGNEYDKINSNTVCVSSDINESNIDVLIGGVLSDLNFIKERTFSKLDFLSDIHSKLFVWIETKRTDKIIYNNIVGYRGYLNRYYNHLYNNKSISESLISDFKKENMVSYMFRIFNMLNSNSDRKALIGLENIFDMIDIDHISRLESWEDSYTLATDIYHYLLSLDLEPNLNHKQNIVNLSSNEKNVFNFSMNRIFNKNVEKISKDLKNKINVVRENSLDFIKDTKESFVNIFLDGTKTDNNWLYESRSDLQFYNKGLSRGKRLSRLCKLLDTQYNTKSTHLKTGKLDKKRLYTLGYADDVFYNFIVDKHKIHNIHISIDGSMSMKGEKWESTCETVVSLAYLAKVVDNLNISVSVRLVDNGKPLTYLIFDSKINNIKKLKSLGGLKLSHETPEGYCFPSLISKNIIKPTNNQSNSYFINISDGQPNFRESFKVKDYTKNFINKISKQMNVLGYFLESNKNISEKGFSSFVGMYGKNNSHHIDLKDMKALSKTLNDRFLKD